MTSSRPVAAQSPSDATLPAPASDGSGAPSSERADAGRRNDCLIVGIGASAGGLEAVSKLLSGVATDHLAFVVVQHLTASQPSVLTHLLGLSARLAVRPAEDGARLLANQVYVAPPGATLTLHEGRLRVQSSGGARPHMPIDHFFRSLATDQGNNAVGVVLSGTGTDGTLGLAAIRAEGGVTFAQDPATAQFDSMPRNAIEAGNADYCLAPEAIANEVASLAAYRRPETTAIPDLKKHLAALAEQIKNATAIDFTHFKPTTVERRIRRRMAIHRLDRMADYVRLCEGNPGEVSALTNDLLINVTSFFRDGGPFEALKTKVIPEILGGKAEWAPLRIWVPACSSGEEAYSIGICVLEALEERGRNVRVQIFGTDLDECAIHLARLGTYAHSAVADLAPERLEKYFVRTDDGRYQVCRRLRELVVFSTHNINRDAPFSRLDLVSCRNLLIYLHRPIQTRVLRTLHYALNPGGFLLLGTSETAGDASDLFTLIDRPNKIYAARPAIPRVDIDFRARATPRSGRGGTPVPPPRPTVTLARVADHRILEHHAPPGVVVNGDFDILYFRGQTEPYLHQPSGMTTSNVLRRVRPELHSPLRRAIEEVLASGKPVSVTNSLGRALVTIVAQPLEDPATRAPCVLVLFASSAAPAEPGSAPPEHHARELAFRGHTMSALEEELARTRDELQTIVEELGRANEDLQSSNEELQSTNEELQSMNEEMETSKEELQSANEELVALNAEVQTRVRDLAAANDDLQNLLLGVDHPIVIVGADLRLRHFTHSAEKLFNLLATDLGRLVCQLNAFLAGGVDIEHATRRVIEDVTPFERELQAADGRWYRLRVLPYRTRALKIQGALISLADIEHLRATP